MSCFKENEDCLTAKFVFKDFLDAMQFINIVAELAEAQNHHPEWRNVYNRVWISLTTHDNGNQITERDRQLASAIDAEPRIQRLLAAE